MQEIKELRQFYASSAERAAKVTQEKGLTDEWTYTNSPLFLFDDRFRALYPREFPTIKHFIEETFAHKKGHMRGLEIGGPGSALFTGFTSGFFARTAGVCLADSRNGIEIQTDKARNHKVIKKDLLSAESIQDVEDWLGEVDALFVNMRGGQNCLPNNPFFMGGKVASWLHLMSDDSVVFAEVPDAFSRWGVNNNDSSHAWGKYINANCPGVSVTLIDDLIYLRKIPGSPKDIPLLPAHTVLSQELQINRLSRR